MFMQHGFKRAVTLSSFYIVLGLAGLGYSQTNCPTFHRPWMDAAPTATMMTEGQSTTHFPSAMLGTSSWRLPNGDFIFFGGYEEDLSGSKVFSNKIYRYTMGSNPDNPIWIDLTPSPLPALWPAGRAESMLWSYDSGSIYLFGGENETGILSDIWNYNFTTGVWATVSFSPETSVQPRKGSNISVTGNFATLVGGRNSSGFVNESLNISKSYPNPLFLGLVVNANQQNYYLGSGSPGTIDGHGNQIAFGGENINGLTNSVRIAKPVIPLTVITRTPSSPSESWPSPRKNHFSWIDLNGDLMIYGGFDGTQYLNDAWKYTCVSEFANPRWIKVSPDSVDETGNAGWPAAGPVLAGFVDDGQLGNVLTLSNVSASEPEYKFWKFNFLEPWKTRVEIIAKKDSIHHYIPPTRDVVGTAVISVKAQPAHGTLHVAIGTTNSLIYTPNPGWTGYETTVLGLKGSCAEEQVTIHLSAVANDEIECPRFSPVVAQKIPVNGPRPTGRRGVSSWIDNAGDLWIWGGRSITGYNDNGDSLHESSNELWKLPLKTNPDDPRWIQISPSGIPPEPQYDCSNWLDYDGSLVLFNGVKMWKYSIASNMWEEQLANVHISPENWPGLPNHGSSWVDNNGDAWVRSGLNIGIHHLSNSTNPQNPSWTYYGNLGDPNQPLPRYYSMEWTASNNNFYLFGGNSRDDDPLYCLWKFDMVSKMWTKSGGNETIPGHVSSASTWTDNDGNFWMYGGHSKTHGYLDSLWKLNAGAKDIVWENLAPTNSGATWPGKLYMASAWKDHDGSLWLYGGASDYLEPHSNELWRFDVASSSMEYHTVINEPVNIVPPIIDPQNLGEFTIVSAPKNGTLTPITENYGTIENPDHKTRGYIYTPNQNYVGEDDVKISLGSPVCPESATEKAISISIVPRDTSKVRNWYLYD